MPDEAGQFATAQAATQRTTDAPMSRFRPRYRQMTPDELALHDAIKGKAEELAALMESVSPAMPDPVRERGANVSLALRHLEDAVYRAVKALTI